MLLLLRLVLTTALFRLLLLLLGPVGALPLRVNLEGDLGRCTRGRGQHCALIVYARPLLEYKEKGQRKPRCAH